MFHTKNYLSVNVRDYNKTGLKQSDNAISSAPPRVFVKLFPTRTLGSITKRLLTAASCLQTAFLLVGCACAEGPRHETQYEHAREAAYAAVTQLGHEPSYTPEELRELPVVGVPDVYVECGPHTVACFCYSPMCQVIYIDEFNSTQIRDKIAGQYMEYVLIHEYIHALLPYDTSEHPVSFKQALALAAKIAGYANAYTRLGEQDPRYPKGTQNVQTD